VKSKKLQVGIGADKELIKMSIYMFENNQFERQITGLKDDVKVDLGEKCFGLERRI